MIDTSDIPPLTAEWFKNAKRRMPNKPVAVTVRLETDVFAWYKAQGDDYAHLCGSAPGVILWRRSRRSIS
jgi:uncharacterized protein (DUF4415 family)